MHTTRNELYKSARHFTYQTQNTKLMHNLPTRTILNVGISCFTNFPVVTERKIMRCLPKESQSKRTKSHRYHNCQRPPSCFGLITRKSDYARLEPTFCVTSPRKPFCFLGGYIKARQMFFQRNGPLFFLSGVMKFWGGTNNFFLGRCLRKLFFSDCIIRKQITCALPS